MKKIYSIENDKYEISDICMCKPSKSKGLKQIEFFLVLLIFELRSCECQTAVYH